jgi:hypothetical protein
VSRPRLARPGRSLLWARTSARSQAGRTPR